MPARITKSTLFCLHSCILWLLPFLLSTLAVAEDLVFPADEWQKASPEEAGFDPARLSQALDTLVNQADANPYQIGITHRGRWVAERHANVDPEQKQPVASTAKSLYSSLVPIAIADGKLKSLDQQLVSIYPQLRETTGIYGPFPPKKRYWLPKDEAVTFRQIVTQTGGLFEESRPPGEVWRYRTDGLVAMVHALAVQYGYYDTNNPDASPGVGDLIAHKLRDPIGASWKWQYRRWKYHPEARYTIFGRFVELQMDLDDMARFGLLYLAQGKWDDRQIIPAYWASAAAKVAPEVRQAAAPEDWKYGYSFWSNEAGKLWPQLPRDSFMAAGFGARKIWICPSLGLVVVLLPDLPADDFITAVHDSRSLEAVVDALKQTVN